MNCVILSIKSPALWPTQQHSCAYCLRLSHACGITSASFDWQLHNSFVVANGGCVTFSLLSRFARCTYNCRCQRTHTSQAPSPPRAWRRESSWLQVNENTSGMCGTVMFSRWWVCWHVCEKFKHCLLLRVLSRQSFCCRPLCLFAVSIWSISLDFGTNWKCNLEFMSKSP